MAEENKIPEEKNDAEDIAETAATEAEEAVEEVAATVETTEDVAEEAATEAEEATERVGTEELKAIAASVPPPDTYQPGEGEILEKTVAAEESATAFDKGVTGMVKETEALAQTAPVKAFGRAVTALQRGIESLNETPEGHDPHNTDVTVFRGKVYEIPLYTSVFLVLGVLTLIEVLVAEIITADAITVPVNLGLAVSKAALVVYYYMHLNHDSKVFRWTLLVPVVVGLLSALFLFAIPTGY